MKSLKGVFDPSRKKYRNTAGRASIVSTISRLSIGDITEESLSEWKNLPREIRHDPSLDLFKRKNELARSGAGERNWADRQDSITEEVERKTDIENNGVTDQVNQESNGHVTLKKEEHKTNKYLTWIKLSLLVVCWIAFTFFLMRKDEKHLEGRKLGVAAGETRAFALHHIPTNARIQLLFEGAFLSEYEDETATNHLYFYLTLDSHNGSSRPISDVLHIPIAEESDLDSAEELERDSTIHFGDADWQSISQHEETLYVNLYTNLTKTFSMNMIYDPSPLDESLGVILGAVVLVGLYVLIVFELVHRTLAAVIGSTIAIALLAAMDERPTLEHIISWIDIETLLLLFGMMVLVAILSQTGVFDYLAVYAFKITKGKVWPLIICLCVFTGLLSAVLDNVTTILLMAPVTIRLCEVMELNPVPVLIFTVIFSNIGGTMTPVGDPPNVIIASNSYISSNGINFANFTLHMMICSAVVMVVTVFWLRFMYRDPASLRFSEPRAIRELKHEIMIWERAVDSLGSISNSQDVLRKSLEKKVKKLNRMLEEQLHTSEVSKEVYQSTLQELEEKYPIKNKVLLIKSCFVLVFVILFFFLHSAPTIQKLSLGWTALLGAVLLLILYNREDIEVILGHVEWATLVFFAALFVLMEALTELGLIDWIGKQTENIILAVEEEYQLAIAILLILWVSAVIGAFVDNIPLTAMMLKIVISLNENQNLNLPLQPLVWSLALGACLGGNGTLIGASANVVAAGLATAHGYKFTFNQFFKIGFPVMILSIIVCTAYLMICHVLFSWH
ncbi:P protein-like [Bradysia coprophila]|uniref:P protein-like n=1 Tax=Bradysia coprophila TaxID=38358 RepID=UPI00187D9519|nr:P protein-like [Bradysia coprophila]